MPYPGNRQLSTHHVTQPHADRVNQVATERSDRDNIAPKPRSTNKPA